MAIKIPILVRQDPGIAPGMTTKLWAVKCPKNGVILHLTHEEAIRAAEACWFFHGVVIS